MNSPISLSEVTDPPTAKAGSSLPKLAERCRGSGWLLELEDSRIDGPYSVLTFKLGVGLVTGKDCSIMNPNEGSLNGEMLSRNGGLCCFETELDLTKPWPLEFPEGEIGKGAVEAWLYGVAADAALCLTPPTGGKLPGFEPLELEPEVGCEP